MKIAIIGLGEISKLHLKAIRSCGYSPILCVDYKLESAKAFAQSYGIPYYSDKIEDLLKYDITHAHVCTPPEIHPEQVKFLLEHKIAVFSEKPLAQTANEAKQLTELAKTAGVPVCVNFNNRSYRAVNELRELISNGKLGNITMVRVTYLQEYHLLPTGINWRYNAPMRALTEIGTHAVDLATFITGTSLELTGAKLGRFNRKRLLKDGIMYPAPSHIEPNLQIDSEDAAVITANGNGGELFVFTLSETSAGKKNFLNIDIEFDTCSASWNSEDPSRLTIGRRGEGIIETYNPFEGAFEGSFSSLVEEFYLGKTGTFEFFESAYKGLEFLEKAACVDPLAATLAEVLDMKMLPVEGTYYKNTYAKLNEQGKAISTAMIGLFSSLPESKSNLHKLKNDEIWHFYGGSPIEMILLHPDGTSEKRILGQYPNLFQTVVPAGTWQGARIKGIGEYALFGCTMAPGFSASDFTGGNREELIALYPDMKSEITDLTAYKETEMPSDFER